MFSRIRRALGLQSSSVSPRRGRRAWRVEALEDRRVPAAVWPTQFFSPYVNTLEDTSYDYAAAAQGGGFQYLTLGFITADAQGKPSWDGQYELGSGVDDALRTQVANLRAQGGDVMISFGGDTEGGGSGQELAVALNSVNSIQQAYQQVIDSYGLTHVDFDIEGNNMMSNPASIDRRSQAIAGLEQAAAAAGRELDVYLTLPTSSAGLMTDYGLNVLDSALKYGVQLAGVNIMTMDYSDGVDYDGVNGPTMGAAAISAAQGLFGQLKTELGMYGIDKTDAQVWQMIGITPQIGVNASAAGTEVFTLTDAQNVETFAQQQGIGRLAFWAIGRDQNPNNQTDLSESYSGVSQQPFDFSHTFDAFGGGAVAPAVPKPPTGLAATAGDGQVDLTWNAVAGAASYNVYRGTASGGEQLLTNVVTASLSDNGLTDGTAYYYTVTAVNGAGESAASAEVSATPQAGAQLTPPAPTNLVATAGDGQVDLTWDPVAGATSYNVYRGTASGDEQWLTNVTSPSLGDTGLTDGTTYYYAVTAGNDAGESAWSVEVSAMPQSARPPAPTGVAASPDNSHVDLSWTPIPGATSYNIYRGTASGGEQWLVNVPGPSFTDTHVTGGTTYYYTVTAGNDAGEGAFSAEVSATAGNTVTRLTVSRARRTYGQSEVLTAIVKGTQAGLGRPTGTVIFEVAGTVLGTVSLGPGGHAVLRTTSLPVGTDAVVAVYNPTGIWTAGTSAPVIVTVGSAPTAVHFTGGPHRVVLGQTAHYAVTVSTATAAAGVPQGQVTFFVDGQAWMTVTVQAGVAGLDLALPVGRHTIRATYSDTVDTNFQDGTSGVFTFQVA